MLETSVNYESNFNASVKYNDITPFEFSGSAEGDQTRKNMPYFQIRRTKSTTCEDYEKLDG